MTDQRLSDFAGEGRLLRPVSLIETSGARAAELFTGAGRICLAVPQLAKDAPGSPGGMNGGDSDIAMPIFVWDGTAFAPSTQLDLPGGEGAESFEIDSRAFLAGASGRTGAGPYDANARVTIWARDGLDFTPFQNIDTFLAKQVRYFTLAGRHFLGLALGVTVPGLERRHPDRSCIYEWTGARFELIQDLAGEWGYNFTAFSLHGRDFLAYADQAGGSAIYELRGHHFALFQSLPDEGGRAFQAMEIDGVFQLAYATVFGDVAILRWAGERFAPAQILRRDGAREFAHINLGGRDYLAVIRFIQGSPKEPVSALRSYIYVWDGTAWQEADSFPSFGATDAAFFRDQGRIFLIVTNSLTPDIRFSQPSVVYEFLPDTRSEEAR
ncbi:MAG: hypothetical protein Q4G26_02010 [Paracoccus sp. (in: a-proteobacteria)]|nr:hypothetical protein [Paracoccus sp. (in: a-proteobacteria)]